MEREDFYRALCSTDNALMHHGILKQKWGQRNGPPYPLNRSDYSAAEKKAMRTQKKLEKKTAKAEKTQQKADRLKEASQKTREELEKEISDIELMNKYNRVLNESVRLSKEYNELTKKGDKAVNKALKNSTTNALSSITQNALTKIGNKAVDSAIDKMFGKEATKTKYDVTEIFNEVTGADGKVTKTHTKTQKHSENK
jgi:hypothetical protein